MKSNKLKGAVTLLRKSRSSMVSILHVRAWGAERAAYSPGRQCSGLSDNKSSRACSLSSEQKIVQRLPSIVVKIVLGA